MGKNFYNNKVSINPNKIASRNMVFLELRKHFDKNKAITVCSMPGAYYSSKKSSYFENQVLNRFKRSTIFAIEWDKRIASDLQTKVCNRMKVFYARITTAPVNYYNAIWIDLCGALSKELISYLNKINNSHVSFFAITIGGRSKEGLKLLEQEDIINKIFKSWKLKAFFPYENKGCPMRTFIFTR
jgi:hypothetical protein